MIRYYVDRLRAQFEKSGAFKDVPRHCVCPKESEQVQAGLPFQFASVMMSDNRDGDQDPRIGHVAIYDTLFEKAFMGSYEGNLENGKVSQVWLTDRMEDTVYTANGPWVGAFWAIDRRERGIIEVNNYQINRQNLELSWMQTVELTLQGEPIVAASKVEVGCYPSERLEVRADSTS